MKKPWIAAATVVLLAAPAAYADVGKGDIEVGASISLINSEQESGGTTTEQEFGIISLSGGYFYTDMVEFKLAVTEVVSTQATFGSINPGADFLFVNKDSTVVPFAGASYGLAIGDFDDTDFLEFHGGIKYFFRERMSLEVKLSRSEPTDSAFDVGHTDLTAGFNVYF